MNNYKNVLIYGYSNSGKAVEKILLKDNINYKIFDDKMKLGGGKYLFKLSKREIAKFDLIIISPAISIYNKNIKFAESIGIRVVSELDFAYLYCPYKIIAVTGTNGKTTTVSLIEHILTCCGLKVKALGNIGKPFSAVIEYDDLDYVIVEVSSFQLEATYKFKPDIGIILNVAQDHIDRHKTMQNYINLKTSIFKNCNSNQIAIIKNDEKIINQLHNSKVKQLLIDEDIYINNGKIFYLDEEICNINDINKFTYIENILASIAVCKILKLNNADIIKAINTYSKMEHRMEFVNLIDGVKYINDSKATNLNATLNAINSIDNDIILLLGGKDKQLNFCDLYKDLPKNIIKIIAFGEARKKIVKQGKMFDISFTMSDNLYNATQTARLLAKSGQVVLLSPACASFDEFKNYEERGKCFKEYVNSFTREK